MKPLDLSKVDWRFAHPKPDVLLSVNVGNIVRSPFLRQSLEQSFNMNSDADGAKLDAILKMVGSVDRVQISLTAAPPKEEGPDFLILITGNLDPFVRLMLTQQSKDTKVVSREIAPNAILFGKAAAVDLAAQRVSGVDRAFHCGRAFVERSLDCGRYQAVEVGLRHVHEPAPTGAGYDKAICPRSEFSRSGAVEREPLHAQ